MAVGSYTLECIFGGSDGYRKSSAETTLETMEKVRVPEEVMAKGNLDGDGRVDWEEYEGSIKEEMANTERYGAV